MERSCLPVWNGDDGQIRQPQSAVGQNLLETGRLASPEGICSIGSHLDVGAAVGIQRPERIRRHRLRIFDERVQIALRADGHHHAYIQREKSDTRLTAECFSGRRR